MSITSYDPTTGLPGGTIEETPPDEVTAAVARSAAAAPWVAGAAPAERRGWLYAVAAALEEHRGELAALAQSETALGLPRLEGEVLRAAGQLRFYADVAVEGSYLAATLDEATATAPALARVNQPLGPVAVFGASNFPFAFGLLGNDFASALAAGCPVVAKAHPAHPLLSARLAALAADALERAGAPLGTLSTVTGMQAGIDLVRADEITAVAFTGSQGGGMALWRAAGERERVIPVYAEMGTVNPVVVTPAAVSRTAEVAAGLAGSFTLGNGQFCTKPGLALAPAGSGFAAAVAQALRAVAPDPVMLTSPIAAAVRAGLGELTAAGGRPVETAGGEGDGWRAPAAVLEADAAALVPGSRLLAECFGPVVIVAEYRDQTELASILDRLQGALAASVITAGADDPHAPALVRTLSAKVGRVMVDDWPTGVAYTWAQQHGGPWPSTTDPRTTSVGAAALDRFVRPVTYQSIPDAWLPPALQPANPWHLPRRINGTVHLAG
ncbi:Alpha-ketoglutaric semialdehyde dehydrogenase [Streptomyces sp. RB5]|uniref:Alpha-ketoglutaric semialdehyde dehydrogenase n=1 Tax=Streptomyces smaragdinus TaxID=2585196 RepID=A0A7K0C9J1_9ACTN|nr:aldehyde dehydrogenase family protein [Streptomyces smaragdinus]MQY10088.1 Alpha-ketoglutaric semialdehyde dehydrogenase [Streptomyces smaragdinus]